MNNKPGPNIIAMFGDVYLLKTYSLYVKNKQIIWVTYFAFSPKKTRKVRYKIQLVRKRRKNARSPLPFYTEVRITNNDTWEAISRELQNGLKSAALKHMKMFLLISDSTFKVNVVAFVNILLIPYT